MSISELESRIVELELRSMEQQRVIEALSDTLFAQHREMTQLTKNLSRLSERTPAQVGLIDASGDEKPPHY